MPQVRIHAVRWVASDPFPGLVECRLVDVDGSEHVLIDKCVIFDDADRLGPTATYPIELVLDCRVVMDSDDAVTIELADAVEAVDGQRTFRIPRSLLA